MSLTAVHSLLSDNPSGRLNFELDRPGQALYLDPMPYRVRAVYEGETVVDACTPYLLHESGRLPVYYFARPGTNRTARGARAGRGRSAQGDRGALDAAGRGSDRAGCGLVVPDPPAPARTASVSSSGSR